MRRLRNSDVSSIPVGYNSVNCNSHRGLIHHSAVPPTFCYLIAFLPLYLNIRVFLLAGCAYSSQKPFWTQFSFTYAKSDPVPGHSWFLAAKRYRTNSSVVEQLPLFNSLFFIICSSLWINPIFSAMDLYVF